MEKKAKIGWENQVSRISPYFIAFLSINGSSGIIHSSFFVFMTWELEGKILCLLLTGQFWDYYLLDDIGEELHVVIFEINLSSVVPVHDERSEPCHVFEINSLHLREEIEARAGILCSKKYQSRGYPSQDTYLRFEKLIREILVESVFGIILVLTTSDNS